MVPPPVVVPPVVPPVTAGNLILPNDEMNALIELTNEVIPSVEILGIFKPLTELIASCSFLIVFEAVPVDEPTPDKSVPNPANASAIFLLTSDKSPAFVSLDKLAYDPARFEMLVFSDSDIVLPVFSSGVPDDMTAVIIFLVLSNRSENVLEIYSPVPVVPPVVPPVTAGNLILPNDEMNALIELTNEVIPSVEILGIFKPLTDPMASCNFCMVEEAPEVELPTPLNTGLRLAKASDIFLLAAATSVDFESLDRLE